MNLKLYIRQYKDIEMDKKELFKLLKNNYPDSKVYKEDNKYIYISEYNSEYLIEFEYNNDKIKIIDCIDLIKPLELHK